MRILKRFGILVLVLAVCSLIFMVGLELEFRGWHMDNDGTNVNDIEARLMSLAGMLMWIGAIVTALCTTITTTIGAANDIRMWLRTPRSPAETGDVH